MAKLDEDKVKKIRRLLSMKVMVSEIAKQFNVSCYTIYRIRNGKSWKS